MLFSRKKKQKNCEYVVDSIIFRMDLHNYPLTIFETTFLCKLFICFFPVENKNKLVIMLLTFFYSNWAHKITLWQSFKTYFYVNYVFCFFSRIQNKNSYYVLNILIFSIGLPDYLMTIFENTCLCKLFICLLFSRKKKQKNCEYVVDSIIFRMDLHDYPLTIFETTFLSKLFICFFPVENKNKNSYYVVNILYSNWAHNITLWQWWKTHFYVNYLFVCCLFGNNNKNS